MDASEKIYVDKRFLKMFLTEDEGVKTLSKYQCKIFNFVDRFSGVGILWLTATQTWVSDATAVTISVKCFNPLKFFPLLVNIFRKRFASYFFIYSRAFNKYRSPTVNLIQHFYWHPVFIAASKEYLTIQIIFMSLESAFH